MSQIQMVLGDAEAARASLLAEQGLLKEITAGGIGGGDMRRRLDDSRLLLGKTLEDAEAVQVGDVEVHLSGRQLGVAEQVLDGSDIGAILRKMRGEGVAERVRSRPLLDPSPSRSVNDGALYR